MHPTDADDWKNQVLEEVLSAVAANPELRAILIFKGARILAKLLPDAHRQSLDRDDFQRRIGNRTGSRERISSADLIDPRKKRAVDLHPGDAASALAIRSSKRAIPSAFRPFIFQLPAIR